MTDIQAIRGMNDILPEAIVAYQQLEAAFTAVVEQYGYQEIRMPLLEQTALFKRSIGDVTDIVEKEMYTFNDRNGEQLSLRPEGTASCVRACLQHQLLRGQTPRLWYHGPMFRYEKPQKGRYRQFWQFGVEVFGIASPDIDAEILIMLARLWRKLGVSQHLRLELNSIGTVDERQTYRQDLVAYLQQHQAQLDGDSQRRLTTNPLRILDSKNPDMRELIAGAPQLLDYLQAESRAHFDSLCQQLDDAGVAYTLNTRLVRGLDYYSRTVFEWVTEQLGAQGTVCAGGRYDGLVAQLGGEATPGIGFAMGEERLVLLMAACQPTQDYRKPPHAYVISMGDDAEFAARGLAEHLRDKLAGLRLIVNNGGGNFKKQFKRADKSGAQLALVLGDDEVAQKTVTVKFLRDDKPQVSLDSVGLIELLNELVGA